MPEVDPLYFNHIGPQIDTEFLAHDLTTLFIAVFE